MADTEQEPARAGQGPASVTQQGPSSPLVQRKPSLLCTENNRQPVCAEPGLQPQLSYGLAEPSSDQLGKFSMQPSCFFH